MADVPINDILQLAQRFIAIPSVTGDHDKAIEILNVVKEALSELAFTPFTSNGYPSLLYSNKPHSKHFKIILNAHLDVVPGSVEQFKPYIKDGKLYGRGAYDMKAAAAVMILLYKKLAYEISYPLGLQLVMDEEVASSDGTLYQIEQGVTADFAIVGEGGSNLIINHENKGIIIIQITTKGQTAHAAYPWKGKNAITSMYEIIATLQKAFPPTTSETFDTTLSVTQITTANPVWNKIPDTCTATFDIRVNKEQSKTVIPQIKNLLPDDAMITVLQERTAFATDPKNAYISILQKIGKQVIGSELPLSKTFGWSDAALFSDKGSGAIEFGPIGQGHHDDEEWVNINSLENYYKILALFIKSFNS